jgi:hypothetical protein
LLSRLAADEALGNLLRAIDQPASDGPDDLPGY